MQFMFVWAFLLIVFPIANAIISMIFANYILVPIFPDCSPPENAVTLVAAFVIGMIFSVYTGDMLASLETIYLVKIFKTYAVCSQNDIYQYMYTVFVDLLHLFTA